MKTLDAYTTCNLKTALDEYFQEPHQHGKKGGACTLISLALFLGVDCNELKNYCGRHRELVDFAKQKCQNDLIERMMVGTISTQVAQYILNTDFGYGSKAENRPHISISQILDEIEQGNA